MKNQIKTLLGFLPNPWLGVRSLTVGMLLAGLAAKADEVTFQFTAQITRSINNPQAVGDTFTGQYTFDTATPDANPSDTRQGKYLDALTAMTIQTGATSHSLVGPLNRIFVHDNFGSRRDEYRVRAGLSEGRSINLVLTDPSEQAINSEALSATPPDLAAWATENVVVSWNGDNGATASLEGVVTSFELVVPDSTPPSISLNGSSVVYVECAIETYSEAGATAADDVDGAVALTIGGDTVNSGSLGTYVVTYDAVDTAGNQAQQVTRTVIVRDTTAPSISLDGPSVVYLECGTGSYVEYGVSAADACDPSPSIGRGGVGAIDIETLGTYTVDYQATDSSGNRSAIVSRTVIVRDTTAPTYSSGAVNLTVECDGDGNSTDYSAWISNKGGARASDSCSAINWSKTVLWTAQGCGSTWTRKVRFTATDASGNSRSTAAVFRTIDTTAPSLDWSISGTSLASSSIRVKKSALPMKIDIGVSDICDSRPTVALSWRATYTSVSGKETDVSSWTNVTIDSRSNSVTINSVPKSYTKVTISARGTDACGNITTGSLAVTVDNSTTPISWTTGTPPGNGNAKGRRR